MNKPLILVVEDDPAVARLISTTLETRNYQYHRVQNGAGALLEAASARPDVILLDLGLPDMDGIDVIRKIRGWSNVPILVVSARSDDTDKVSALDAGADDYLTKPFSVEELLARLRVALRRFSTELSDVGAVIDVNTRDFLGFADFFFDGIIFDLAMNSRINNSLRSVDDTLQRIRGALGRLMRLKSDCEARSRSLEEEYGRIIAAG